MWTRVLCAAAGGVKILADVLAAERADPPIFLVYFNRTDGVLREQA